MKAPSAPEFSQLKVTELTPDGVSVILKPLGRQILSEIAAFNLNHPDVEVYQYIIMPDHVHLLVNVKRRMKKHLGTVIGEFKGRITSKWRVAQGDKSAEVFQDFFNDRIIFAFRSLDAVFKYIRQNPYRLAVRIARPDFFAKPAMFLLVTAESRPMAIFFASQPV